ncbi:hypothetical protein N7456_013108 [Penicillium angulare]|uniref:Uncharacterized protein n=1 Tax=Penicillium angulare TaxID=116970 RepID=A0A9W9EL33_9EURO|nr:hypothetical protein N7456_013108 [Penicillium angulare]
MSVALVLGAKLYSSEKLDDRDALPGPLAQASRLPYCFLPVLCPGTPIYVWRPTMPNSVFREQA